MTKPYVAFGKDELIGRPTLKKNQLVRCPHCGKRHRLTCGKGRDGNETDILLFYKCGESLYLAPIDGADIMGTFK